MKNFLSRRTSLQAMLGILTALLLLASPVSGAPITFAFEAEVIDVDVLAPADLPFSVENGDVLKGRFSFEPVDAQPAQFGLSTTTDTVQNFSFSLMVDSTLLSTSAYSLRVRDNSPTIDGPFLTDGIFLSCSSSGFTLCEPETVPDSNNLIWFFSLPFSADGSVLDGADIPADASVWNQFTPAHLSLTFQEPGVADVLRINARIEQLSIVPEPSSLPLVLSLVSFFYVTSRFHLRRSYPHNSFLIELTVTN